MRLYWEVARRGFRRLSAYRGATVAGIFTNTVFGFVHAYVLIALFAVRPVIDGYYVSDAVTYSFVAQGLIAAVAIWGWFEIEERIRTGDITTDLLRPCGFLAYWLAYDYGRAAYQALARGIPPFLLAGLVFDLRLPEREATWLVFTLSVVLAVTVSFAIRAMVNLFALWFLDSRGLASIVSTGWIFLSGLALPLAIFPKGCGCSLGSRPSLPRSMHLARSSLSSSHSPASPRRSRCKRDGRSCSSRRPPSSWIGEPASW